MIKRVWISILVFFAVLATLLFIATLLVEPVAAQLITIGPINDHVTYWGDTSQVVTIAWDPSTGATRYEWQAYHAETSLVILAGNTATTSISFTLPRAGHYIIRLRACKPGINQGDPDLCSDWIDTLDATYAQVDGLARSWWVYRVLAPPGDIEFGQ